MAPSRNRRPGFSRRAQYGLFIGYVIAAAGALVGAILLIVSYVDPTTFAPLRMTIAAVTAPVSTLLAGAGRGIASVPDAVGSYIAVRDENARLHKELHQVQGLLTRARTLNYDNRRLRALLAMRDRGATDIVAARLVSSSASSTRRFAILNAGTWQGVHSGMPVRGPEGLVGRVIEVGPNAARVMLLSDPESIVPVRRTRDGMPALAAGRGDGLVDIRSVAAANVAFSPGDMFVTSGTGGLFAPDIPVARIMRPARDIAPARTFAQPDTLDYAVVEQIFMPVPAPPPPNTKP